MKKSTLSVILLLVCVAAFLMSIYLGVDTFLVMLKLDVDDLSINESLPAGSVLGLTVAFSAILGGFALFEFLISLVGFVASLVNINIAEKRGIKIASYVFFGLYSLIIIFAGIGALLLFKGGW